MFDSLHNLRSMFTEYPGSMCVRSRLLRTAHTQAYTQWRRGAARSVYQRADSLQKLKSESLHHGSST